MNMAENGTASTTPTIRNAVRGSHFGSLRGRVSSTPYANRMHNPMVQPRITSTNKDAYVCRPTRKPNPPDTASVNRNRGQANTRANPARAGSAGDVVESAGVAMRRTIKQALPGPPD